MRGAPLLVLVEVGRLAGAGAVHRSAPFSRTGSLRLTGQAPAWADSDDALAFRHGRSSGLEPPIPAGGSGVPVDEFLTVAEVAAILKLNQMTVPNWIDQGPLNVLRSLLQA